MGQTKEVDKMSEEISKEEMEKVDEFVKKGNRLSIYIQNNATGGNTYGTDCLICQGKGKGLINMVPIPTHRSVSRDIENGDLIFNYICKACTKNSPDHFDWVWVDKLPVFPDDLAITEVPRELNKEGKRIWCEERGINYEDYE